MTYNEYKQAQKQSQQEPIKTHEGYDADSFNGHRSEYIDAAEVAHEEVGERGKVYQQIAYANGISIDEAKIQVDGEYEALKLDPNLPLKTKIARETGKLPKNSKLTSYDIYQAGNEASMFAHEDTVLNPETSIDKGHNVPYNIYKEDESGTLLNEDRTTGVPDDPYNQPEGFYGRILDDNPDYAERIVNSGHALANSTVRKEFELGKKREEKAKRLGLGIFGSESGRQVAEAIEATSYTQRVQNERLRKAQESPIPALDAIEYGFDRLIGETANAAGKALQSIVSVSRGGKEQYGEGDNSVEQLNKWLDSAGKTMEKRGQEISAKAAITSGYNQSGSKMLNEITDNLFNGEIQKAIGSVNLDDSIALTGESIPMAILLAGKVSKNIVGIGTFYSGQVATAIDEAKKLSPTGEISNARVAAILGGEAFSVALEKIGLDVALGRATPKMIKDGIKKIQDRLELVLPDGMVKSMAKYATDKFAKILGAGAVESVTELGQEGQRIITTHAGQKDILTKDTAKKLTSAAIGGNIGGSVMSAGVQTVSIPFDIKNKAKKTLAKDSIASVPTERLKEELNNEELGKPQKDIISEVIKERENFTKKINHNFKTIEQITEEEMTDFDTYIEAKESNPYGDDLEKSAKFKRYAIFKKRIKQMSSTDRLRIVDEYIGENQQKVIKNVIAEEIDIASKEAEAKAKTEEDKVYKKNEEDKGAKETTEDKETKVDLSKENVETTEPLTEEEASEYEVYPADPATNTERIRKSEVDEGVTPFVEIKDSKEDTIEVSSQLDKLGLDFKEDKDDYRKANKIFGSLQEYVKTTPFNDSKVDRVISSLGESLDSVLSFGSVFALDDIIRGQESKASSRFSDKRRGASDVSILAAEGDLPTRIGRAALKASGLDASNKASQRVGKIILSGLSNNGNIEFNQKEGTYSVSKEVLSTSKIIKTLKKKTLPSLIVEPEVNNETNRFPSQQNQSKDGKHKMNNNQSRASDNQSQVNLKMNPVLIKLFNNNTVDEIVNLVKRFPLNPNPNIEDSLSAQKLELNEFVQNIKDMIANHPEGIDKINLTSFMSSNSRSYFYGNTLNPHLDKNFARELLSFSTENTVDLTKPNGNLDGFKFAIVQNLSHVSADKLGSMEELEHEFNLILNDSKFNVDASKTHNISREFHGLGSINAINELNKYRNSLKEDKSSFDTNMKIDYDALTSGVGILNSFSPDLSGRDMHKFFLSATGIVPNEEFSTDKDSYTIFSPDEDLSSDIDINLKELVEGKMNRDIPKKMVIGIQYGQSINNAINGMAKELFEEMLVDYSNYKNTKKIAAFVKNVSGGNVDKLLTEKEFNKVIEYISETVGEPMVPKFKENFGHIFEFQDFITNDYSVLVDTREILNDALKNDSTAPTERIDNIVSVDKFGSPKSSENKRQSLLKKRSGAGEDIITIDGVEIPMQEVFSEGNFNSAVVLPVHGTDNAIISLAINNTVKRLGIDKSNFIQIFDGALLDIETAKVFQEEYNKATYEVLSNYSLAKEYGNSLERAKNEVEQIVMESNYKGDKQALIDSLHKRIDRRLKLRNNTAMQIEEKRTEAFKDINPSDVNHMPSPLSSSETTPLTIDYKEPTKKSTKELRDEYYERAKAERDKENEYDERVKEFREQELIREKDALEIKVAKENRAKEAKRRAKLTEEERAKEDLEADNEVPFYGSGSIEKGSENKKDNRTKLFEAIKKSGFNMLKLDPSTLDLTQRGIDALNNIKRAMKIKSNEDIQFLIDEDVNDFFYKDSKVTLSTIAGGKLTPDTILEVILHEIRHHGHLRVLNEATKGLSGVSAKKIESINNFISDLENISIEELSELSNDENFEYFIERLNYIKSKNGKIKTLEFMAIMSAESKFIDTVGNIPSLNKKKGLLAKIKDFIDKLIRKFMKQERKIEPITVSRVQDIIDSLAKINSMDLSSVSNTISKHESLNSGIKEQAINLGNKIREDNKNVDVKGYFGTLRKLDYSLSAILGYVAKGVLGQVTGFADGKLSKSKIYRDLKAKTKEFENNNKFYRKWTSGEFKLYDRINHKVKKDLLKKANLFQRDANSEQSIMAAGINDIIKKYNVEDRNKLNDEIVNSNLSSLQGTELLDKIINGETVESLLQEELESFDRKDFIRNAIYGHARFKFEGKNYLHGNTRSNFNSSLSLLLELIGSVEQKSEYAKARKELDGTKDSNTIQDRALENIKRKYSSEIKKLNILYTLAKLDVLKEKGDLKIESTDRVDLDTLIINESAKEKALNSIYTGSASLEKENSMIKNSFDKDNETVVIKSSEFTKKIEEDNTWEIVEESKEYMVITRANPYADRNTGIVEPVSEINNNLRIDIDGKDKKSLISDIDPEKLTPTFVYDLASGSRKHLGNRYILDKDIAIDKLGLENGIAQRLSYTHGHGKRVKGGLEVNNDVANLTSREISTIDEFNYLMSKLRTNDGEAPIFVGFSDEFQEDIFSKNTKMIKEFNKYYQVKKMRTKGNLGKYKYVLAEASDIYLGFEGVLFGNPNNATARKYQKLWKNLIINLKLNVAIKSPKVQAFNHLSNISILSMENVPFDTMLKYQVDGFKQMVNVNKLIKEQIKLTINFEGDPTNVKNKEKLDRINKKLESNEFYKIAIGEGFVQSIVDEVIAQDTEVSHKFEKIFKKFFEKFDDTTADKYISPLLKFSLKSFGSIVTRSTKPFAKHDISKAINRFGERIQEEGAGDKKFSELLNSAYLNPGSEVGKIAVEAMQITDTIAKWTLYNHILNIESIKGDNLSEADIKHNEAVKQRAIDKAIEYFIDYRQAIPSEAKFLSDVGVVLFPTFNIRVQPVILKLLANHPVKFVYLMTMAYMLSKTTGVSLDEISKTTIFNSSLNNFFFSNPINENMIIPSLYEELIGASFDTIDLATS